MSSLGHLRTAIDLPGLAGVLAEDTEGKDRDVGGVLRWWQQAQAVVGREVAAGRATVPDARALQQETLGLMAKVPGLQFVTNEQWGAAEDDEPALLP